MSAEVTRPIWRRWCEVVFATCTAWLVLQNVALLTLLAWGSPADALAAGTAVARQALALRGEFMMLVLGLAAGFALAVWLVHAPSNRRLEEAREVHHER